MAPREANNPFADQYLTIEYDATAMMLPHDPGAGMPNMNGTMDVDMDMDMDQPPPPAAFPMPVAAAAAAPNTNTPPAPATANTTTAATATAIENPTGTTTAAEDDSVQGSASGSPPGSENNDQGPGTAAAVATTPPVEVLLTVNRVAEAVTAAAAATNNNMAHQVTPSPPQRTTRRNNAGMHAAGFGTDVGNGNGNGNANMIGNGRPFATRHNRNRNHNHNNGHQIHHSHSHEHDITMDNDDIHQDIDPLAVDFSNPDEEETWSRINAIMVEAAIASAEHIHGSSSAGGSDVSPSNTGVAVASAGATAAAAAADPTFNWTRSHPQPSVTPARYPGLRRNNTDSTAAHGNQARHRRGGLVSPTPSDFGNVTLPPHPGARNRRRLGRGSMGSVLDQDPSMSCSDDEPDIEPNAGTGLNLSTSSVPGLDVTQDSSSPGQDTSSDEMSSPDTPIPPMAPHVMDDQLLLCDDPPQNPSGADTTSSPSVLRRSLSRFGLFHNNNNNSNPPASGSGANIVTDEDTSSASVSSYNSPANASHQASSNLLPMPPSPRRFVSNSSAVSHRSSLTGSVRSIHWNAAFDSSSSQIDAASEGLNSVSSLGIPTSPTPEHSPDSSQQINLSFGPTTTVADLKYFAERGCIVPLLRALDAPRLKTLGTRMLADYAKMPNRRVAVASNKRILEFCCRTMLELPDEENMGTEWPAREYAVETIRSLTATEDSDSFLMNCSGMLKALAVVAKGGPFASPDVINSGSCQTTSNMGLVSGKARLHACIAIMNLSCGKANKIEIASISEVLDAMKDVMLAKPEYFSPATSSPVPNGSSSNATPKTVSIEARLKATTCVKNLSNADANDGALLAANGLVNALGQVAVETCSGEKGATNCTTNACLALMNLSISKDNKNKVFKTEGVMEALMTVLQRTSPFHGHRANNEARIKACSALSNLAIGYSNKIPMFNYPGFVDCILQVIETDTGEARTKACSILWSFAAEMKNQVPVVRRGDILPTLVRVAEEDHSTEARFKCVAALTLLAESLDNAMPLLESGALHPLMDILHDAGADPTQWKGQTASWCVGFLMNMAQSDDAAPYLREAGVVELLAPLLTLDHYQSLKAAMAVTFVCRYDEDDETYDLLRKTENVIPKIIDLLHNTLDGKGGKGYKYGVFTLRSSVGCISSLASGPEFMKERIATKAVFESLLRVVTDFCVNGGTDGAIVGGGRDDTHSSTLAIRALHSLTEYLIPIPGSSSLPFGPHMDERLMIALKSLSENTHHDMKDETHNLASDAYHRIQRSLDLNSCHEDSDSISEDYTRSRTHAANLIENSIVASLVQGCCIGPSLHGLEGGFFPSMVRSPSQTESAAIVVPDSNEENSHSSSSSNSEGAIRTFLLTDGRTGRRFAVPTDPSGGRLFNDERTWCYRRGRFCRRGEVPDPNFQWTEVLQEAYTNALRLQRNSSTSQSGDSQPAMVTPTASPVQVPQGSGNSNLQTVNYYEGNQ